jgi:hypothetical protein
MAAKGGICIYWKCHHHHLDSEGLIWPFKWVLGFRPWSQCGGHFPLALYFGGEFLHCSDQKQKSIAKCSKVVIFWKTMLQIGLSIHYITNLACDKLIMKIIRSLFIHRFVHFTHEYHALKTHLTHRIFGCMKLNFSENIWFFIFIDYPMKKLHKNPLIPY